MRRVGWESRSVSRSLVLMLMILLGLVATACGGGSSDEAGVEEDAERAGSGAVAVPHSVEFLGDLAATRSQERVEFGSDEGTYRFPDGTVVSVPAAAFAEPTVVTATLVELAVEEFFVGGEESAAFVLSTDEPVALGTPIHLDLAVEGAVVQFRDGNWIRVEGPRVEIVHFSEVPTLVLAGEPQLPESDPSDGFNDGEFLFLCINTIAGAIGDPEGARGLGVQFAYQMCTRGLIDRYKPGDVAVSTRCVGDKIDDLDIRAAIDRCVEEARAAQAGTAEESASATRDPAPASPADLGPTSWSGSLTANPDAATSFTWPERDGSIETPIVYNGGEVEILREPGTDNFSIEVDASIEGTKKYALSSEALEALLAADVINGFEPNWCVVTNYSAFSGSGTWDAGGRFLVFSGVDESYETRDLCDLEDLDPTDLNRRESEVWVEVTEAGLFVSYRQHEVLLDGVPVPVGG